MKKFLAVLSILLCFVSLNVFANGSKETTVNEPAPLKFAIKASEAGREVYKNLVNLAKENGIDVEIISIPDPVAGQANKFLVSLMGGETFDMYLDAYANMSPFYEAGVVMNLEDLIAKTGYDVRGTFGEYPAEFDGEIYGLPAFVDTAVTLYNKDLFDRAGIPYPTAEDWTWEKYIEIASKISELGEGIYGGYNPLWVHYNYMYALQKGAEHFKADGSANYDDPRFKEAVKFYYDLGNKYHAHPEYLVQKSKQMPLEYFTSGNVGMTVCGGWTTVWLMDHEKYPRDWKAGILPMPHPEGEAPSTSVVISNFWIPTTSKQPELAFKCIQLFAENMYLMGGGKVPARIDLPQSEIDRYISEDLIGVLSADGITVEDIAAAWFDPEVRPFPEKATGPAAGDITKIFNAECGLYGIGEQDLDTTMKNIQEKVNKAILDSKK